MFPAHSLAAWTDQPPSALLVDRDADSRKLYSEYLKLAACTVDEAEDGCEALAKAISSHPDVIIMETRLAGINGFDLCSLLRADTATRATPILFVTGDAFEKDIRRAEAVGADAVLIKPCLPETLLAEMVRIFQKSSELRARGVEVRARVREQTERTGRLIARSEESLRRVRVMLSRTHNRRDTTDPPLRPPDLVCPACDQMLRYQRSHIGGVSERHSEQWDYFECPAGCGAYEYRQRTRKLRRV